MIYNIYYIQSDDKLSYINVHIHVHCVCIRTLREPKGNINQNQSTESTVLLFSHIQVHVVGTEFSSTLSLSAFCDVNMKILRLDYL